MIHLGSPNQIRSLDPAATALWDKLRQFPFDRGTGPRTFAVRLAAEQGWSASFTTLAIGEYRRFLFLFALDKIRRPDAPEPVRIVPSAVVDKVWHLHLLYTQSYWETLCRDILGGPLHHLPADGSTDEAPALDAVYTDTLEAYRRTFGHDAPESVWPPVTAAATGNARWLERVRSRGVAAGPLVVMAGVIVLAALLIFHGAVAVGIFILAMLAVAAAGSRNAGRRRRAVWSDGNSGGDSAFTFGGGSGDDSTPAHHDGGHHGGGHDAGGHSHSCGGGHSCGGHGCGGGCGGH